MSEGIEVKALLDAREQVNKVEVGGTEGLLYLHTVVSLESREMVSNE